MWPVRLANDDRAVAEHVVLGRRDQGRAAVLERGVRLGPRAAGRIGREHLVVLELRHEPLRAGEQVRVGRVIPVIVRQREMRDVGGFVAGRRELRRQRRRKLHEPLLIVAPHQALLVAEPAAALMIGDGAGIPHQHAARMNDEIRGDRQLDCLDVGVRQPIARRLGGEHAAVENVDARGGDGVALRLKTRSNEERHEDGERAPQCSAKHEIPRAFTRGS